MFEWDSGHTDNIFQAKTVGSGNDTIASCARDGQVRMPLYLPVAVWLLPITHGL